MTALVARWGWYATVFLALLGMASVVTHLTMWSEAVRATLSLDPSVPDSSAEFFEVRYYMHPVLTLVHILPGFVVMALGPLQFLPAIRARHLQVHRWSGRVVVATGLVAGASALTISFVLPVFGGFTARVAVVLFGAFFLFALVRAYVHVRRREIAQHREWMIRAFAVALGISTFRVLEMVFLLAGVPFLDMWTLTIWLSFPLNMLIAEVWINVTRPKSGRAVWRRLAS